MTIALFIYFLGVLIFGSILLLNLKRIGGIEGFLRITGEEEFSVTGMQWIFTFVVLLWPISIIIAIITIMHERKEH